MRAFTIAILMCVSALGFSQEKTQKPMPMQLESARFLSGTWTGDVTHTMGGRESKMTDTIMGRVALNGRYVILEHSNPDMQGIMAMTYNDTINKWTGIWLDSKSATPTHFEGTWTGSTLSLMSPSLTSGGVTQPAMRVTITKASDMKFDLKLESGEGSRWMPVVTATYTKN